VSRMLVVTGVLGVTGVLVAADVTSVLVVAPVLGLIRVLLVLVVLVSLVIHSGLSIETSSGRTEGYVPTATAEGGSLRRSRSPMIKATTQSTAAQTGGHHRVPETNWLRSCHAS
jgi:hypothetical protein